MPDIPNSQDWWLFGAAQAADANEDPLLRLPPPPPWRQFSPEARSQRGVRFLADDAQKELVNAALFLRRPLLITGKPGTGKSTLAYAVARELKMGKVLLWPITTRSTLADGLYRYDAITHLREVSLLRSGAAQPPAPDSDVNTTFQGKTLDRNIGEYIRLGPLGTALLPSKRPRLLLIDEIDKSDIDLPNDLLHTFEEGEYSIPELKRLQKESPFAEVLPYDSDDPVRIEGGHVRCNAFPLVILTSNNEREFSPAFLRRCLRLEIKQPNHNELADIVASHFALDKDMQEKINDLITAFFKRRESDREELATDQLLNAVYLAVNNIEPLDKTALLNAVWRSLNEANF